jgi:hypothetical protein
MDLPCKPYPPYPIKGGVEGVSTQRMIIQLTHTRRRVFILMEAQTYINPRVSCVPLFSMSVSTPTLKSSHKSRQLAPIVGLTRSSFMRAMTFESTTKFLPGSRWFMRSLLFITNKFGDISLQEPKLLEIIRSGTGRESAS